ncbi:MAG: hypothetical protein ACI4TJ_05725, partial [Candidatus Cryptobacteroides sp.]
YFKLLFLMKYRLFLIFFAALVAVACEDILKVPAEVVDNDAPGVVNPVNVIVSRPDFRYMLGLSAEDVELNTDGLPVKILGCQIEYLPATKADGMVVRVKDYCYAEDGKYDTFDLTIGANGFANKCRETEADGEVWDWRFGYDAQAHLIYLNYDGNTITMSYDRSGNMVKLRSKGDSDESAELFYTAIPNYGWMPFGNNYGHFPCRAFYLTGTDIFWVFYLAGLVGIPTANVPEYVIYRDEELSNGDEYYHHHLYRDEYGDGVYVLHDQWSPADGPEWTEYEPAIEDWRKF